MRPTSPYPKCIGDPSACSGLACPNKTFHCENELRRRETANQIKNGTYHQPQTTIHKKAKVLKVKPKMLALAKKNIDSNKRISSSVMRIAFCGDGILRYCIGKIRREYGASVLYYISGNPESNLVLSNVVQKNPLFFNLDERWTVHNRGTIYEARICGIFEDEGLDAAIRFFVTTFSNAYPGLQTTQLSQIPKY